MKSQILDFVPFPMLQLTTDGDKEIMECHHKTSDNVKDFLETILVEQGWNQDQIENIVVVTDEAPNLSFG